MTNEARFGNIPRQFKVQAKKAFAGSGFGQLGRAIKSVRSQISRSPQSFVPGVSELASIYRRGGIKGFVRAVSGLGHRGTFAAIENYVSGGNVGQQAVTDVLKELGPVGSILGAIVGHGGKSATLPRDLQSALDLIGAFADNPSVINALQRILEGRGAKVVWPGSTGAAPGQPPSGGQANRGGGDIIGQIADALESANAPEEPEPEQPITPGRMSGGAHGPNPVTVAGQQLPPDHPLVTGQMIETPQSSNVYAFGYDIQTESLFVRFKAGMHEGGGSKGGSGGGDGGHGGHRPHRPGAIYIYHHVPKELFLEFTKAPSKGMWVWDRLRIRGTISGHQFDYGLVGVQGGYVPRKATIVGEGHFGQGVPGGEAYLPRQGQYTNKGRTLQSSLPPQLVRPLGRIPNSGQGNNGQGGFGRKR